MVLIGTHVSLLTTIKEHVRRLYGPSRLSGYRSGMLKQRQIRVHVPPILLSSSHSTVTKFLVAAATADFCLRLHYIHQICLRATN